QLAVGQQLARDRAPLRVVELAADAVGAESVMPELAYPLGVAAEQHVHQVTDAETLPRAHDGREQLLRRNGPVERVDRLEAGVAVATSLGQRLAEVRQQRLAAAAGRLAERQQRLEPLPLRTLVLFAARALAEHARHLHDVGEAVRHERLGW